MSAVSRLEEIEARRAARKAAAKEGEKEQLAIDLEAIDALEEEHGDSNVGVLAIPFDPKNPLPVRVAVKTPRKAAVKRYRDTVKPRKDGSFGDTVKASEQLTAACLIYPDVETFGNLCEARPGVAVALGTVALRLASARDEDEGKG